MTQNAAKQGAQTGIPDAGPCKCPTAMSSMPRMCMGMMGKRPSGLLLMLPGVLMIAAGAVIVIEPQILVWLLAAGSVILGIMLLLMAGLIRGMGAQPRE